jgi:transaldolase
MQLPKVFYDGASLTTYANYPDVVGFTTNTTILRQAGVTNYKNFYDSNAALINDRPISFQIFSDSSSVILEQARQIHMLGKNIYVKVPLINSQGDSLLSTIQTLLQEGIRVNVTALFTNEQLIELQKGVLDTKTPCIVSVFGGRISDTGVNPKEIIGNAVQLFSSNPHIEILWAGCKDNLVIQNARDVGCHIVTLPDAIISRINRLGKPLDTLSQETVKSFLKDGLEGGLQVF